MCAIYINKIIRGKLLALVQLMSAPTERKKAHPEKNPPNKRTKNSTVWVELAS